MTLPPGDAGERARSSDGEPLPPPPQLRDHD